MSHSSLGLTLLPIPVPLHPDHPVIIWIRKLPCHLRLDLRIGYRLFQLHQCVGLFRCRFVAVTPVMVTQAIPSTMLHYFCLLTGIASARPSAFAEGERFELPKRFAACLVSGEVLSSTQPTFLYVSFGFKFLFKKISEPRGGLGLISLCASKMYIALNAYETKINLKNLFTINNLL